MRLIDADALEKKSFKLSKFGDGRFFALRDIRTAPTIDAVPVVRCWQCKHRSEIPNTDLYLCHKSYSGCKADDYCSCGERKEGDG